LAGVLRLYVGLLREAGAPLKPRIDSELRNHFGYMSAALGEGDYFVANTFSAADIQLSFALDAGAARAPLKDYPNLVALHERLKARPAYQRALARGGPYEVGR
jgi:glutathione S-transferase